MPVYDYNCVCGEVLKDEFVVSWESSVKCPKCGDIMRREFPLRFTPDPFPKFGLHLKHVCPEGKTFHSKSELKRYAKEHNLELAALL